VSLTTQSSVELANGLSDCVMPINRATQVTSDHSSQDGAAEIGPNEGTSGKKDLGPSTVTLSGLLNAIDGVASQVSNV